MLKSSEYLLMVHNRIVLFFIAFSMVISGCSEKSSKEDALAYYSHIAIWTSKTRPAQTAINNKFLELTELVESDAAQFPFEDFNALRVENLELLSDLYPLQDSLQLMPPFDGNRDLVDECEHVLSRLIVYHESLGEFLEGVSSLKGAESRGDSRPDLGGLYQDILDQYRKYKYVRRKYCNRYGIEYDDLKSTLDSVE